MCGGDSFSAVTLLNLLSSHLTTSPTLLQHLLTQTFEHFLLTLHSHQLSQKRAITDDSDLPLQPFKIQRSTKSRSRVVVKSKGRYHSTLRQKSDNRKTSDTDIELKLNQRWKIDLHKCIDSSPLLIDKGIY